MPEVFTQEDDIVEVGPDWLERLKDAASASPLRRARLCLHHGSNDAVQEMILVLCNDVVLFRPHRHLQKTESFHLVEGELYVLVFDDSGNVLRTVHMGPPNSGRTFCYRLNVSHWHAILPRSRFVVFHETTAGPFRAGEALFAPWAPSDPPELGAFLERKLRDHLSSRGVNCPLPT